MNRVYRYGGKSSKHSLIFYVVILMSLLLIGLIGWRIVNRAPPNHQTARPSSAVSNPESATTWTIQGRYLLNGTIVWARGIEKWSQRPNGSYDYAHPFSGLPTFNRGQYDAWVADLECPITDKTIPFQTQVDDLMFNCRPEYLNEAAKYFNLFDLANNHTDNMQHEGLLSTRKYLDDAKVQYFGNYDPGVPEDTCEVISLPVKAVQKDKPPKGGALPVAFCAWHYFYRTPKEGEIERMREYAKVMPVFAFVHAGVEYRESADDNQVSTAHKVIDQNAEFVIVNNPHWVQNSEVYKGKLIVYSTGNFIFDQLDSEGMRSASIDVTMTMPYDQTTEKWLELGSTCSKWHDDCLKYVKEKGLSKPKLSLTYQVVAGDNSNHLTKRGSLTLQQAVENRLGWQRTIKELGQKQ